MNFGSSNRKPVHLFGRPPHDRVEVLAIRVKRNSAKPDLRVAALVIELEFVDNLARG